MNPASRTLLLIPAYNEQGRLAYVLEKCIHYFENILVVDDGSEDMTLNESLKSKANFVLSHCINCGQGTAIRTGIRYFLKNTNFDYLITLDADNQHSPEEAFLILKHAVKIDADAVFGSRLINSYSRKNIPTSRLMLIILANFFEKLFYGTHLTDSHNGLRVLSREACEKLSMIQSSAMAHATEIVTVLSKSKIFIHEYPCKVNYDINNKNSQSPFSSLNIISDLFQSK